MLVHLFSSAQSSSISDKNALIWIFGPGEAVRRRPRSRNLRFSLRDFPVLLTSHPRQVEVPRSCIHPATSRSLQQNSSGNDQSHGDNAGIAAVSHRYCSGQESPVPPRLSKSKLAPERLYRSAIYSNHSHSLRFSCYLTCRKRGKPPQERMR